MKINEIQDEIIEEFEAFDDWMDKYAYLIELGNDLEPYNDTYRVDQNILEGCQSKVWLHAWMEDGKVHYMGDSDAIIVKGIVALIIRVLSEQTPDDILEGVKDLYFIERIGLKENLSPTRSNGLVAMVKQMQLFALALKAKAQ